jgi:AraC-like DNA-binding protein
MDKGGTTYLEFLPHPGLREYIKCFWHTYTAPGINNEYDILPDGYFDMIFSAKDHKVTDISMTGIWDQMITVSIEGGTGMFGVRFKPFALTGLLMINMSGILNSSVGVDPEEFNLETPLITDSLTGGNLNIIIEHLNMRFLSQQRHSGDSRIKAFFDLVDRSSGTEPVERICREIGLSTRQVCRKVTDLIGIGAKEYSGIARFRDNLASIAEGNDYDGFYDQSHLIKNFKKYTGMTPGQLNPANNVRILQYSCKDLL